MTEIVFFCTVFLQSALCVPVHDLAACRAIAPHPLATDSECSSVEVLLDPGEPGSCDDLEGAPSYMRCPEVVRRTPPAIFEGLPDAKPPARARRHAPGTSPLPRRSPLAP